MPKKPIRLGLVAEASLNHFSTLLRLRRKEKRLTIDELSDRLGVSVPTVRNLLTGSPSVAIGTYFEAAYILGVPLFDPDDDRFKTTGARMERIESLLPQRVRKEPHEIDDDF